jgi:hypothetical protein
VGRVVVDDRGVVHAGIGVAADGPHSRRRAVTAIKEALRELRNHLSLLNHQVGRRLELRDVDLDCLELVQKHGPLTGSP